MMRLRRSLMVGAIIGVVLLGMACASALGRGARLRIWPQKMSAEAGKYVLLPPQASLTDGDAVPLYQKAAQMLPDRKSDEQVQQCLKMPVVLSGAGQVEQVLKPYRESLKCLTRAVRCRDCRWPAEKPETVMPKLIGYRRLGHAVQLWARYEIVQKNYEGAILAMQTGFGAARHLTQGSTLLEFAVGEGIATMMRTEVEAFIQAKDAPNLYAALAALPKPFLDVEKAIDIDKKSRLSTPPAEGVARELFEDSLKSRAELDNRLRATAKRLDCDLAAWQCVEAIRSYAASHGGQLPQTLADIQEVSIPKDPMTGVAFYYTQTDEVAALESPAPGAGNEKDALRYQIIVEK